jgi:hypothetical protein
LACAATIRRMNVPVELLPVPAAEPGSYDRRGITYRSAAAFLRERPRRLRSRERDIGLRWRDGSAMYRAAWVEATGELYLVQLGAPEAGGGHVELLADGLGLEELDEALPDWRHEQDRGRHSLDWFRSRVRALIARRGDGEARARSRACGGVKPALAS